MIQEFACCTTAHHVWLEVRNGLPASDSTHAAKEKFNGQNGRIELFEEMVACKGPSRFGGMIIEVG